MTMSCCHHGPCGCHQPMIGVSLIPSGSWLSMHRSAMIPAQNILHWLDHLSCHSEVLYLLWGRYQLETYMEMYCSMHYCMGIVVLASFIYLCHYD